MGKIIQPDSRQPLEYERGENHRCFNQLVQIINWLLLALGAVVLIRNALGFAAWWQHMTTTNSWGRFWMSDKGSTLVQTFIGFLEGIVLIVAGVLLWTRAIDPQRLAKIVLPLFTFLLLAWAGVERWYLFVLPETRNFTAILFAIERLFQIVTYLSIAAMIVLIIRANRDDSLSGHSEQSEQAWNSLVPLLGWVLLVHGGGEFLATTHILQAGYDRLFRFNPMRSWSQYMDRRTLLPVIEIAGGMILLRTGSRRMRLVSILMLAIVAIATGIDLLEFGQYIGLSALTTSQGALYLGDLLLSMVYVGSFPLAVFFILRVLSKRGRV